MGKGDILADAPGISSYAPEYDIETLPSGLGRNTLVQM